MSRQKRKPMAEINVVPYIDVMLVLLVIFMITAPMLTQGVKVDLPQAKAAPIDVQDAMPIIISVDKDGSYFINDENQQNQAIGLQNLLVRIMAENKLAKQNNKKKPILVRGDKQVAYGQVIALMATLKKAGIENVGLMTEAPQEGGKEA
jgi:biopolymer transport protein TolR